MQFLGPRVKFTLARSTMTRFQDVVPFRTFLLTPMLKPQSAIKTFKTWPIKLCIPPWRRMPL